jgi:hypothetical protein
MKANVQNFLARVEEIAAEEPGYELGHSGDDHLCDCIGLVIGALRRCGVRWSGIHGTNYAARSEMETLAPVTKSADLSPGELVYKIRSPGSDRYALPGRYQKGGSAYTGDLLDYYHVGIVVSNYPLRIRHMTSPKPRMDTNIGKWAYHGWCRKVSANGGTEMEAYQAKVIGGNLNLRKSASAGAERITQIPDGSTVTVTEELQDWCQVEYNGKTGYVVAKYLAKIQQDADGETITVSRKQLEAIYDQLGDMLGLRG